MEFNMFVFLKNYKKNMEQINMVIKLNMITNRNLTMTKFLGNCQMTTFLWTRILQNKKLKKKSKKRKKSKQTLVYQQEGKIEMKILKL